MHTSETTQPAHPTICAARVSLVKQESWESDPAALLFRNDTQSEFNATRASRKQLNLQEISKADQVPRMVVEITGRCKMGEQLTNNTCSLGLLCA